LGGKNGEGWAGWGVQVFFAACSFWLKLAF